MADYYFDEFEYRTYKNDVINSQGFYVSNDVGLKIPCGIRRVSLCDGAAYQKAEAAARFAIEKHNESENANLMFREILNLYEQPTAGKIYYITMAAEDSPGDAASGVGFSCYQAKVWEKISGRYRVDVFRLAPFHAASKTGKCCYVRIENLQPSMDETYLYYQCFYRVKELESVEVYRNIPSDAETGGYGFLRFKSESAAKKFIDTFDGKLMPLFNQTYTLLMHHCMDKLF